MESSLHFPTRLVVGDENKLRW
ncbi:hypothetical protein CCACVL1_30580 [Corchorus capsularis]|uniref:Uncharacterized protein n=1 Tax=Corchorus capsularis TaxID=210143 RepID=A0A1R3FWF8_COCAP|nr:hypothetical protein CCACVL1_30580 [Corchorus capsularis]